MKLKERPRTFRLIRRGSKGNVYRRMKNASKNMQAKRAALRKSPCGRCCPERLYFFLTRDASENRREREGAREHRAKAGRGGSRRPLSSRPKRTHGRYLDLLQSDPAMDTRSAKKKEKEKGRYITDSYKKKDM